MILSVFVYSATCVAVENNPNYDVTITNENHRIPETNTFVLIPPIEEVTNINFVAMISGRTTIRIISIIKTEHINETESMISDASIQF